MWGRIENHTGFWWADLKDRDLSEGLGIEAGDIKLYANGIE